MHFSKKLISAGLIAVLLGSMIFHAHFYEKIEADKNTLTVSKTETVRLWYSDDSLTDYFTNAAVAFHESNPGIRVIPTLVESSEYLDKIYKNSIEGEEYPDVYLASNDALEKAYLSGIASEIQNSRTLSNEHFSQAAIDAVTYSNQKIAYPLFFETSVLAFNKTYLEKWADAVNSGEAVEEETKLSEEDLKEAISDIETDSSSVESGDSAGQAENAEPVTYLDYVPKNIDELLSFADAYNAPDGVTGVFRWDVTDVFYNYFFVGKYLNVGGPAGDDAQNVDIYNANTISCLEVYQNLNQFFSIDAETSNYKSVIQDFIDGKSVFTVVTSDAIKTIRNSQQEALEKYNEADALARSEAQHRSQIEEAEAVGNKETKNNDTSASDSTDSSTSTEAASEEAEEPTELQKAANELKTKVFDFDFARIPMVGTELEAKSLSVTNALVVNGFSTHMEAANKFASFATTTYCGSLYQKSGKIAASLDANYDEVDLLVFQNEYANSVPLPKMMEASNLWVQLEVLFTKVWDGGDIQTLVVDLSKQIANQTIDEDE